MLLLCPERPGRRGKAPSPTLTTVTGQAEPSGAAAVSRCRCYVHNGISVLVPGAPAGAHKQVHKQVLLIPPAREIPACPPRAPTGMLPPALVPAVPVAPFRDGQREREWRGSATLTAPQAAPASVLVYFAFVLQDLETLHLTLKSGRLWEDAAQRELVHPPQIWEPEMRQGGQARGHVLLLIKS